MEKLNKWAELLLDTGKRNNLINFKDSNLGTAEVVAHEFFDLIERAEHETAFEVYDPKLEDEEEDFDCLEENNEDNQKEKYISKLDYIKAYEEKLKKHQILVYSKTNKPMSALKNISKKAKTAIEETGVNIAYMAFGFINWKESENSDYILKAPILLVPISIHNESAVEPYIIKTDGDDMVVNPTFTFKLQNDFGIKLPELAELSVKEYFDKIQELVSKLKWSVTKESKIGCFSFQKINMYKDLTENSVKILKNKNVLSLIGEGDESNPSTIKMPSFDLIYLSNVVDADSSQAEAIEMAKNGQSFVLQGPPGTGKSQTITNIIAECLNDGKKILFVSEKLAALNVVYDKLKSVGLEEFCLELHSHKSNKKQVIDELCNTLKEPKSSLSDKAEKELKLKKESQELLDAYAKELHSLRPVINKTLYQLQQELSACRDTPLLEYTIDNINSKGDEYIEKAKNAITRYVGYSSSIGYNYKNNCWYGYNKQETSYQAKNILTNDIDKVIELCKSLDLLNKQVKLDYDIELSSLSESKAVLLFFDLCCNSKFITPKLLIKEDNDKALIVFKKMQLLANELLFLNDKINENFDEDIYKLDAPALHKKLTRQFDSFFSRMFSKEYKSIIKEIKLCKKDGKIKYKQSVEILENLKNHKQKNEQFDIFLNEMKGCITLAFGGISTDFKTLLTEINKLKEIQSIIKDFGKLKEKSYDDFKALQKDFSKFSSDFSSTLEIAKDSEKIITESFNIYEFNVQKSPIDLVNSKLTKCKESVGTIENWCDFSRLLQNLDKLELKTFVDFAIINEVQTTNFVQSYKKLFYLQWIDYIIQNSNVLKELSRISHDETVERFKEKDKINFEINKAKIKSKLSNLRPNIDMVAPGSSIAVLLREGEKKRKLKSVRSLLSEIGDLVQLLKPCMLMSPLSVSTFLSADIHFDVVVFDEASQIFPQDAIGAIYRGKQLIVVGDSKQMPPSNFFNNSVDSSENDEEDITDFESILDLCSTSFVQSQLKWHYRSKFEELIAFSNKNFYKNNLVTFPSSQKSQKGNGVDYYYVDGVFDRISKTNRIEAEKIVELVFENIEKYPQRSLGVVAFSISQQTLIDKLIAKRRQQDLSKEEFFKSERKEAFFVKNLETVQGDERDTIIFSIAYAKDSQGRLLLNFGPINREGGERRLNVAVTRAKCNVQLVSSMRYTDIDLSRTKSVGATLLREYLDYAENGGVALERAVKTSVFESCDSEFEMEVYDFLREKGFSIDTQVGCSSFKIDLALKEKNSSNYLLAIECDGASYHSSKTARDRDRLRQEILERMGWRFYRIWSTDWFRNSKVEKEKLLLAVKNAIENAPITKSENDTQEFFEEKEDCFFEFKKYRQVNEYAIARKCNNNVISVVKEILSIESPLSEEWLLKRIAFLFGREKVTSIVKDAFNNKMWNCTKNGIIRKNGFLYLENQEIPMLRVPDGINPPRAIKYISIEELSSGLKELLKQNISCEKAGLFKFLAQQLGFSRIGDSILNNMESALGLIKSETETNGQMISLK